MATSEMAQDVLSSFPLLFPGVVPLAYFLLVRTPKLMRLSLPNFSFDPRLKFSSTFKPTWQNSSLMISDQKAKHAPWSSPVRTKIYTLWGTEHIQ